MMHNKKVQTYAGDFHFHQIAPKYAFIHPFLSLWLFISERQITPGGCASVQMEHTSLYGALKKTNEDNLSFDTHRPNSKSGVAN